MGFQTTAKKIVTEAQHEHLSSGIELASRKERQRDSRGLGSNEQLDAEEGMRRRNGREEDRKRRKLFFFCEISESNRLTVLADCIQTSLHTHMQKQTRFHAR